MTNHNQCEEVGKGIIKLNDILKIQEKGTIYSLHKIKNQTQL
jgi:hypothetical protein